MLVQTHPLQQTRTRQMRCASRGSRPVVVLALGNGVGASSIMLDIREHLPKKKCFLSGIARMRGGGGPLPELFLHFFINCIFGLFLHKCMFLNSELLFRLIIYVSLPSFNIFVTFNITLKFQLLNTA